MTDVRDLTWPLREIRDATISVPLEACVLSFDAALSLGIDVGNDPKVAVTSGGVVLLSNKPFDEAEAKRFAAIVDMDGDDIFLPPFTCEHVRSPSGQLWVNVRPAGKPGT